MTVSSADSSRVRQAYGEALGSVTFGFERSCYSSTAAFDLVHSLRIQSVSRRATKRFTRVNLFVARRETLCIRRLRTLPTDTNNCRSNISSCNIDAEIKIS